MHAMLKTGELFDPNASTAAANAVAVMVPTPGIELLGQLGDSAPKTTPGLQHRQDDARQLPRPPEAYGRSVLPDTGPTLDRRHLLRGATAMGLAALSGRAHAADTRLPLNGTPAIRALTTAFPQKGRMVLQRTRPPLLETPFEVFDRGVFTPNDQFYVRWHWAVIPEQVDVAAYHLAVRGLVNKPLSLGLADILALPRVEIAAVNQCSGNSRGFFEPRVAGGQWANGAMGNAKWVGVRLRDVLDRAGVKPAAVAVRFNGMDEPVVAEAPDFMKSLEIDHARDGEVMLAF